jgi:flagellar basal body-associated protein FliL
MSKQLNNKTKRTRGCAPSVAASEVGFAHLILLLLVVLVIVGGVVYFVIMGSKSNISESLTNLYAKPSPTMAVTPTPEALDEQLNSLDDSEPSEDFGDIDTDISNL